LEEGFNAKSNLKNSETRYEKSAEDEISASNSQMGKIDTKVETKHQRNPTENKGKHDNRNIIRFEPDVEDEKLEDTEPVNENKDVSSTPKKRVDKTSESTEKKGLTRKKESFQDTENLGHQISKNQNSIRALEKKIASLSEDVDDLISLYEIVSVEMNPFVGLSKITRSRLDALANIDKEFESLKTRVEELETSITGLSNSKTDDNFDDNKDFYLVEDIDDIIDEALEYIIEIRKIDDIIDEFVKDLKSGNIAC